MLLDCLIGFVLAVVAGAFIVDGVFLSLGKNPPHGRPRPELNYYLRDREDFWVEDYWDRDGSDDFDMTPEDLYDFGPEDFDMTPEEWDDL